MNRNRTTSKGKIIIAIVVALLAILLFWLVLRFVVNKGELDEQFGDTGGWGENTEEDLTYLTIGDDDYVSEDDVDVYVIAGTDAGGADLGEGYNGELADFILVAILDNTTEKYGFYQIDRNTMVNVPIIDEEEDLADFAWQQVCTAHWYGTDEDMRNNLLCLAVSDTVGGLETDGYYVLNMKNIGDVNDAIGGVTVDIDTDMTNLDPAFTEGATVHLTGSQAESFLRARKSVGEGTNQERMARQQLYIQRAYSMVIDQLRENPDYINDLYAQLDEIIESDGTDKRISQIADKFMRYENVGFISFNGTTELNDTIGEGIEHEEFYQDPASVLSGLRKVMNIKEDTSADDDDEEEEEDISE